MILLPFTKNQDINHRTSKHEGISDSICIVRGRLGGAIRA